MWTIILLQTYLFKAVGAQGVRAIAQNIKNYIVSQ
jgi:hypothetical protein